MLTLLSCTELADQLLKVYKQLPLSLSVSHVRCDLPLILSFSLFLNVSIPSPSPSLPSPHSPLLSSLHRREIGLEKFFKQSLLNSVKRRNLRTMVQNAFQQYESLTMEGCVFQFFNLLSKFHAIDVERFTNCAVGVRMGGQGGEKGGIGEILLAAIPLKVDACAAFPNTASS